MKLAELPGELVAQRLEGRGILLQTGPFTVRIHSGVEGFTQLLRRFYANFPVVPEPTIADFHVRLTIPGGIRRRWHPQVLLLLDGIGSGSVLVALTVQSLLAETIFEILDTALGERRQADRAGRARRCVRGRAPFAFNGPLRFTGAG